MGKFSKNVYRFVIDVNNFTGNDIDKDTDTLRDQMSSIGFDYTKSNDGIMSYIDIDENISELYIRDNGDSIKSIYTFLSNFFKNVKLEECTKEILFNNELSKNIKENEDLYNKRIILFERFRRELTSTDDVLDKIIDKGMDYLDDIDKDILENKKPSY